MFKVFFVLFILGTIFVISPFISFGACNYTVASDAARMFGIEEHEFRITFYSGTLLNTRGEAVSGTFQKQSTSTGPMFNIRVRNYLSRPMTIATIFHEFAHAAQYKYNMLCENRLYNNTYNHEQHAELLAFDKLWRSHYRWNALHMPIMHTFGGKPGFYRAPTSMWRSIFTGAPAVSQVRSSLPR